MEGGYDPDCRRTFDWDESHWNKTVFAAVKRLIGVRKKIVSEEINYAAQGGLLLVRRGDLLLAVNNTGSVIRRVLGGKQREIKSYDFMIIDLIKGGTL